MSLPAWKAKREAIRLVKQISAFPRYILTYYASTPYYDIVQSRYKKIFLGSVKVNEKLAIFLIYPASGLTSSHLISLEYIIRSGYAPIVVSNRPLSTAEREQMLPKCHAYIERPNVGYDFGGYRDGILHASKYFSLLKRLVLLNDSVWFPLPNGMNWLAEAESLGVDYAGAVWAGAVAHTDPENYAKSEWVIDKNRRNFHYASFALSISPNIFKKSSFIKFWKRFRLTEEKNKTVRRGEIGLTRWVVNQNHSHGATTELLDLPEFIRSLGDEELWNVFDRLISVTDPVMKAYRRDLLAKIGRGKAARAHIEKVIICSVARQGASYAIADLLIRRFRFAFLKKSPASKDKDTARIMLDIGQSLEGNDGAAIRAEIEDLASPFLVALTNEEQETGVPT